MSTEGAIQKTAPALFVSSQSEDYRSVLRCSGLHELRKLVEGLNVVHGTACGHASLVSGYDYLVHFGGVLDLLRRGAGEYEAGRFRNET